MKFIIGKSQEEKEFLNKQGFSFFKKENEEYWFLLDGNITFSECDYEIRDRVNV